MARKFDKDKELELLKNRWQMSNQDKMNAMVPDDCTLVDAYATMDEALMYRNIEFPPGCPVTPSNKVLETRRLMASKMAPRFPEGSFGPVDDADNAYADMANQWLEHWQESQHFPKSAKEIIEDGLSYNDPAFEVIFDPYDNYPEGSIKIVIRHPLEYAWDPFGNQWCIIMDHLPKEQLAMMYPAFRERIMAMPDAAPLSLRSGDGITGVTHRFDKEYPKTDSSGLGDYKTGYVRIYKMFERCYDYEEIDEDETIDAVFKEVQALEDYEFQVAEPTMEGGGLEGMGPTAALTKPYQPNLAFDETDDHPKHIELLNNWYMDWAITLRRDMGEAAQSTIDLVRPEVEAHIKKHTTAIEYMRQAKLPIGKRVLYPGGKMTISLEFIEVLDVTDNPIGMFPIQPFSFLRYRNQRWGRPFLRYLIPMQERRDTLVAQWAFLLKSAVPKWKRQRRGTEDGGHIDNDPTRIIDCDDAAAEGWSSANINYPDIITLIHQIDADFQSFSNIFEAYRGQVPSGVKSGKGIEALSSMAETVTNLDTMSLEESAQTLFLIIWTMAVKYLPPTHFQRVLGSEFEPEFWKEKIDINKIQDIPLAVKAEFKDPSKTNKLIQLEKLSTLLETPFGQYISPRAVSYLFQKNAELTGMDEIEAIQEEFIAGIEAQTQQLIAQQLAQIQLQQIMSGGGAPQGNSPIAAGNQPLMPGGNGSQTPLGAPQGAEVNNSGGNIK